MDLKDQLKKLFPEHIDAEILKNDSENNNQLWMQDDPIICKYEKLS